MIIFPQVKSGELRFVDTVYELTRGCDTGSRKAFVHDAFFLGLNQPRFSSPVVKYQQAVAQIPSRLV